MNKQTLRQILFGVAIATILLTTTTGLAKTGFNYSFRSHTPQLIAQKQTLDSAVANATLAYLLKGVQAPPEQPVIRRTIVEGNYALATWRWGEAGGQSILIRKQGHWQVVNSGGGAVDQATLQQYGVPANTARTIMQREQAAQAQ